MNIFHITIPPSRILTTLSLIDDLILKLHDKTLEKIQDDMYSVCENLLFEKNAEENRAGKNDDDKSE